MVNVEFSQGLLHRAMDTPERRPAQIIDGALAMCRKDTVLFTNCRIYNRASAAGRQPAKGDQAALLRETKLQNESCHDICARLELHVEDSRW